MSYFDEVADIPFLNRDEEMQRRASLGNLTDVDTHLRWLKEGNPQERAAALGLSVSEVAGMDDNTLRMASNAAHRSLTVQHAKLSTSMVAKAQDVAGEKRIETQGSLRLASNDSHTLKDADAALKKLGWGAIEGEWRQAAHALVNKMAEEVAGGHVGDAYKLALAAMEGAKATSARLDPANHVTEGSSDTTQKLAEASKGIPGLEAKVPRQPFVGEIEALVTRAVDTHMPKYIAQADLPQPAGPTKDNMTSGQLLQDATAGGQVLPGGGGLRPTGASQGGPLAGGAHVDPNAPMKFTQSPEGITQAPGAAPQSVGTPPAPVSQPVPQVADSLREPNGLMPPPSPTPNGPVVGPHGPGGALTMPAATPTPVPPGRTPGSKPDPVAFGLEYQRRHPGAGATEMRQAYYAAYGF